MFFLLACPRAELRRVRTLELPIRFFSLSAYLISSVESISAVTGILKISVLVTIYKSSLILEEPSILVSKTIKILRLIPGAIAPYDSYLVESLGSSKGLIKIL